MKSAEFLGVWDGQNHELVWEWLSKSHFQWNMDFLDFGLHFDDFCDLEIVPQLTYGSHWESQGCPLGVLGAGLDFMDF